MVENLIINKMNEIAALIFVIGTLSLIMDGVILFVVLDIPEKIKKFGKKENNEDMVVLTKEEVESYR